MKTVLVVWITCGLGLMLLGVTLVTRQLDPDPTARLTSKDWTELRAFARQCELQGQHYRLVPHWVPGQDRPDGGTVICQLNEGD